MRSILLLFLAAASLVWGADNKLSGRRAPGWSLPDSQTKRYDLQDFRGKWLILDFMKSDCPRCAELSKTLEQAKAKYGEKVAILSVVIAPPENTMTVGNYIKTNKVTIPIVFDMGQMTAAYFNMTPQNPTFDTPHLFVINPQGQIVADMGHDDANPGKFQPKSLLPALDKVLGGK
jgi:peroxiredoxin